ncbi:MAG: BrnT family toxin [Desulfococcaceae bacterium]
MPCTYKKCILEPTSLAWDPEKALQNLPTGGIRFSDVEPVFYHPLAMILEERSTQNESRFILVGSDALCNVIVVVHT